MIYMTTYIVFCEDGKYSDDKAFGPFKTKAEADAWVEERTVVYADGTTSPLAGDFGTVRVIKVEKEGPGEG